MSFNNQYTVTTVSSSVQDLNTSRVAPLNNGLRLFRNSCAAYVNINNPNINIGTEQQGKYIDDWRTDSCTTQPAAVAEASIRTRLAGAGEQTSASVAPHASFTGLSAFTVACWVKNDELNTSEKIFLGQWAGSEASQQCWKVGLFNGLHPQKAHIYLGEQNATTIYWRTSQNIAVTGSWQHWVFAFDDADPNNTKIFLNGVSQAGSFTLGQSYDSPLRTSSVEPLRIAGQSGHDSADTYMYIDDLLLYNIKLTDTQCQALYSADADVDFTTLDSYSNLISAWIADGDSYPRITDQGGNNSNDMTMSTDAENLEMIWTADTPPD